MSEQQQYSPAATRGDGGSVGPVIAVVAVIAILGLIAGVIGRLCSGRRIMGRGEFDVEGWLERKCSSCLDGRVDRSPVAGGGSGGGEGSPTPEVKVEAQEAEQSRNGNGQGHS